MTAADQRQKCRYCREPFAPKRSNEWYCSVPCRFWDKANIAGPDDCWPWAKNNGDYGFFWFGTRADRAHRVAYQLAVGPIPANMCICHSCDNRPCVNPRHLWPGTLAQNNQDRARKGRTRAPRGEASHFSKLKASDIPKIRGDKRTQRVIAADFGVDAATVGAIRRGQTWTHI